MLVSGSVSVARGLFDAIFRPSRYVGVQQPRFTPDRWLYILQLTQLTGVYVLNLLLYAVPLTLSGVGFDAIPAAPGAFVAVFGLLVSNAEEAWEFAFALYRNSYFITGMVGIVLLTYHGTVKSFGVSRGFVRSFQTVIYTSSAYLAGIYTVTTFLSTADGVERAEQFTLAVQKLAFTSIISALNPILPAALEVPFQPPESIPTSGFSPTGRIAIAALVLLIVYFLYTLYLGTILNHGSNRRQALTVVLGVMAAPIVYVAGSALFSATIAPVLL